MFINIYSFNFTFLFTSSLQKNMATMSDADITKLLEEWHNIERCNSPLAKKKEELKTEINHRQSQINAKVTALKWENCRGARHREETKGQSEGAQDNK